MDRASMCQWHARPHVFVTLAMVTPMHLLSETAEGNAVVGGCIQIATH